MPLGSLRVDTEGGGEWAPRGGAAIRLGAAPLPAVPPPPPRPPAPAGSPPGARRAGHLVEFQYAPAQRRRRASPAEDSLRPASPALPSPPPARHGAESVPSLAAAEELALEIEDSDYESDITNGESDFARPVVPWEVAASARRDGFLSGDDECDGARSFRHVKLVLGDGDAALGGPLLIPCSAALARFLGGAASARGVARGEACPLLLLDPHLGSQVETVFQIRQMCAVQQPGSHHPFQSWFCVAKPAQPHGGGWGLFARLRRLQEGDAVLFTFPAEFEPCPEEASGRRPPPPQICLKVNRARKPPPLHVWEPNVESEVACEAQPAQGAPANLRLPRPFKYLRFGRSLAGAGFLKSHKCGKYWQSPAAPVSHRVRVVPSGGGRGWGVLALECIPAGTHIFNYCGEVLDAASAARKERAYRLEGSGTGGERPGGWKSRPRRQNYFLFDIIAPPVAAPASGQRGAPRTLSAVVDGTQHGNVARFVNHRCGDASLRVEVRLAKKTTFLTRARHRCTSLKLPEIRFYTKRAIAAGEELTVDYLAGDRPDVTVDPQKLRKELRCTCTSPACRGWIF